MRQDRSGHDDGRRPLNVFADIGCHRLQVVFTDGLTPADHFEEKIGAYLNDIEWLIDFMCNSRGHLPQGCHFAGLDQLGFPFDALGDIGRGGNHDLTLTVFGAADVDIDKKRAMSFAVVLSFSEQQGFVEREVLQCLGQLLIAVTEIEEVKAQHLLP